MVILLEMPKLPPDERIIVLISVGGDERPSPIRMQPKEVQIMLADGREILEPMVGVGKSINLIFWNAHFLHYVVLVHLIGSAILRKNRRAPECRQLFFDLFSGCRHWHASTMKGLTKQHVIAGYFLVS